MYGEEPSVQKGRTFKLKQPLVHAAAAKAASLCLKMASNEKKNLLYTLKLSNNLIILQNCHFYTPLICSKWLLIISFLKIIPAYTNVSFSHSQILTKLTPSR